MIVMRLQEAISEYKYDNIGQFRAIAESLGYEESYNKGSLLFTRQDEEFRVGMDKIRSFAGKERDLSSKNASMDRICQFLDWDRSLSPDYRGELEREEVGIVNWGDLKGDGRDRFTVIDHKNRMSYTGKDLYEYALLNGYQLDGKGSKLEKGELSKLTEINGKPGKIRLQEEGVSIMYRKESLVIPERILGQKLSQKQKQDLLEGNVIALSTRKGDIFLQVDKELNRVVVRSEKELSIPAKIGDYELTTADKYLLANGYSLDNKLVRTPEGYIITDISMLPDKTGYTFSNVQRVSETKAKDLLSARENGRDVGMAKDPEKDKAKDKVTATDRDLEKELREAVAKKDYEKMASLKEEGYKPSEEVIRGLGQDAKIDQAQAVVIEKLFGTKPEVRKAEEITDAREEGKEEKMGISTGQAKDKTVFPELDKAFTDAVAKEDFVRLSQLKEQGYTPSKEMMESIVKTASGNTQIAVQKIFGMKGTAKSLGEVKLAHGERKGERDIKRPLVNTVNKMFSDL